jgi:cell wall-associated NlpC family hydrolase
MSEILIAFLLTFGTPSKATLNTTNIVQTTKQTKVQREAELRKWVPGYGDSFGGINYKYAGKTSNGFDCSGFTKYIFNNYGIELSGHSGTQAIQGEVIDMKNAQPGDLIFFGKGGKVTHVGIVYSNTAEGIIAVHSTLSKGIMTQNVTKSSYWRPKIMFVRDVISKHLEEELIPKD